MWKCSLPSDLSPVALAKGDASAAAAIKIVGLSGAGKSTLIRAYTRRHPHVTAASYSEFLSRHGDRAAEELQRYLADRSGLVLMDEHLEFGGGNLAETYRRERTRGIAFLDVPVASLIERRRRDATRTRSLDLPAAFAEYAKAGARAASLAERLAIPLLCIREMSFEQSLVRLERFIRSLG